MHDLLALVGLTTRVQRVDADVAPADQTRGIRVQPPGTGRDGCSGLH